MAAALRRRLLAPLLALAGACAAAPPRAASVQFAAAGPAALPARFVNRLVLVDVTIDGERVAPFLLDTGSDVSVVDRRTRDLLLLRRESAAVAHGTGGAVSASFARGRSLDAGPIHAEEPVFLVLDLAPFERAVGARVGGILGLDLLGGFALEIDYPRRAARLAPSGMLAFGAGAFPLEARDGLVGLPVGVGAGGELPLLLDTGMTGAVSLDADEAARRGIAAEPGRDPEWRVGVGGGTEASVGTAPWTRVGERALPALDVVLQKPAGGFAGAVGGGLLRFFRVVLDFPAGRAELSDAATPDVAPQPNNGMGIRFDFRFDFPDEGWRVEAVRAGSPADRAGLRAGDVVTRVDGAPLRRFDWRRIRESLGPRARETRLTTLAPGGERVLTLSGASGP